VHEQKNHEKMEASSEPKQVKPNTVKSSRPTVKPLTSFEAGQVENAVKVLENYAPEKLCKCATKTGAKSETKAPSVKRVKPNTVKPNTVKSSRPTVKPLTSFEAGLVENAVKVLENYAHEKLKKLRHQRCRCVQSLY
jgi:hypothetical protein